MVSADSTTEASENSSSESEKMVHSRSPARSQSKTPIIPPPTSSDSESDDDSDALTPPPRTYQQQGQKKEQQPQKQKEQLPPLSPSPHAFLSNKNAATKMSAKRPGVHSLSPSPSPARIQIPPPSSSDDDSEAQTPPPKTHQHQEQKKEQQSQKQKKEQPPPPSPSALLSNKIAVAKTSAKRSRVEENDGIPEAPSTKKKMTGRTVQHSDEVPAKEKKKAQKQNVAEAISTPSSPQQSARKALQVWNSKDELAFLNGLLTFTKGGKEFPKNMSPVYDYVRNMMDNQYSNKKFSDKIRRLKAKWSSLMENIKVNNYKFKSADEAASYKLCQQLWGVQDEGVEGDNGHYHNAETLGNASMNGKVKTKKKEQPFEAEEEGEKAKHGQDRREEEEDGEKTKDGGDQREEDEEGHDERTRDKIMANGVQCNRGDVDRISRELYSKLCEERDDMVNEMKNTVVKLLEESQAKTMAMVQNYLLKESQAKTRVMAQDYLLNARADRAQLPYRDMMTGIPSGRWAPGSSRVKAEAVEEKWCKQEIAELEIFSERLDLRREECEMCLEGLRASANSGRS